MSVTIELSILVGLILLNAFFAMAEMAVVSSRRIRLQNMSDSGHRGAALALRLVDDPGRLLSVVQVGITLIGIISGAFGGATLGARLGGWLDQFAPFAGHGEQIAFALVVLAITALSLIIGELVPKRMALANPERVAALLARPVILVATVTRPFVWLLEKTTAFVMTLLRIHDRSSAVTQEEVKIAIAEGAQAGVIDQAEQVMIEGVLRLADRNVTGVMAPRPDVYWIDLDDSPETLAKDIADCPYSRIVVVRGGDVSQPLGVVQKKDLLDDAIAGRALSLEPHVRMPVHVPDTISVMRVLEQFRTVPVHLAFIIDEYGDFLGLVTLTDVMRAIAGNLPEEHQPTHAHFRRRADGSWLVDGRSPIQDVIDQFRLSLISEGQFNTAAGLALDRLARIPEEGDAFRLDGWRVEIIDMDGNRIDKLLFIPQDMPESPLAGVSLPA